MAAILEHSVERVRWVEETPLNGICRDRTGASHAGNRWEAFVDQVAAMEHLSENWDGLGAKAPSHELLRSTLGLINLLQQQGVPPPSAAAPSTSGTVLLTWHGPGDAYCEVELTRPFHGEVMVIEAGKEPEYFNIPNA
jgi:hypothetical protein